MSGVETQLFDLSATTPDAGFAHGSAMMRAGLEAGAEFRRGVQLGASFQLAAEARGALDSVLAAQLSAGVSAAAAVNLDVGFPLDLFEQAGIVVRFRAQAEAAAFVRARVGLDASELATLTEKLLPPVIRPMQRVFLEEVDVGAGFWARAAFAAQIQAEAVLAASLLPTAPGGAGFSFSLNYGVGLGGGAGKAFVANAGVRDPRRLLDRLASELSTVVMDEAQRAFDRQPPNQHEAGRRALAVTRVLLPLATRTAFSLGLDLATASTGTHRAAAAQSVVQSFVAQSQEVLLDAVAELALHELAEAIGTETVIGALLVDEDRRSQAVGHLRDLDSRVTSLGQVRTGDIQAWIAGVTALAAPVDALLGLGGLPSSLSTDLRDGVARLWAAAILLDRVTGWVDNPVRGASDLFGFTPVVAPGAGSIAARIASSIGKGAAAPLVLSDLVSYLSGQDLEARIRKGLPEIAPVLDWLCTASGAPAGKIVQRLLVDLAAPDQQTVDTVLGAVGQACSEIVNAEIVPRVLQPIKDKSPDDEALHLVIDRIATPLLVALPVVVIPGLATLDDADGPKRLREALSAVLLQILNRFVMATVDVLLERALTDGRNVLLDLGAEVQRTGTASPAFGLVSAVASRSVLPVSITPKDLATLLDIAAGMTQIVNQTQRRPIISLLGTALELGLGEDATRAAVAAELMATDARINPGDTDKLLEVMKAGAFELVRYAGPRILDLVEEIFLRETLAIAELIEKGAEAVVAAAKAGIAQAQALLSQLEEELRRLGERARQLMAQIAARVQQVAARVSAIQAAAVERVRSMGRSLLDDLLRQMPDATHWTHPEIRRLYDLVFGALRWALDAPLALVQSVAGWVQVAVLDGLKYSSYDGPMIRAAIRSHITAGAGHDLHFDLALYVLGQRIGPGKVTIHAQEVLACVADAVLADPTVTSVIDAIAADALAVQAVRAQEAAFKQAMAEQGPPPDPHLVLPGLPIGVEISGPPHGGPVTGKVSLRIRIAGANRSFVTTTLGVPPRVGLRLNGQRWDVDPAHWVEADGGIELAATVLPVASTAAASTVGPEIRGQQIVLGTQIVAVVDGVQGDLILGRVDETTEVLSGVPVRRGPEPPVRLIHRETGAMDTVAQPSSPVRRPAVVPPDPVDVGRVLPAGPRDDDGPRPRRGVSGVAGSPDSSLDVPRRGGSAPIAVVPSTVRGGFDAAIPWSDRLDVAGLTTAVERDPRTGPIRFAPGEVIERVPLAAMRSLDLGPGTTDDVAPSRVEGFATTGTSFHAATPVRQTLEELNVAVIAYEPTVEGTAVAGLAGMNVVQVAVADGEGRVAHARSVFHLLPGQIGG